MDIVQFGSSDIASSAEKKQEYQILTRLSWRFIRQVTGEAMVVLDLNGHRHLGHKGLLLLDRIDRERQQRTFSRPGSRMPSKGANPPAGEHSQWHRSCGEVLCAFFLVRFRPPTTKSKVVLIFVFARSLAQGKMWRWYLFSEASR
jgi:hypothetical protein